MHTIMIVDDMPMARELIAEALAQHGYHTVCASGGIEALHMLRDQTPSAILLDVMMPGLDGISVLRTIRRNPQFKDIPVILLTDSAERNTVLQAAERRASGYILKSEFSIEKLLTRLQDCLGAQTHVCGSSPAPGAEPAIDGSTSPAEAHYRSWRDSVEVQKRDSRAAASRAPQSSEKPNPDKHVEASGRPNDARSPGRAPASLGELTPVIKKNELVRLVTKGLELRPLGTSARNVAAATRDTNCSAEDIACIVGSDQALSIRILKVANSSCYARGHAVGGIKEAIRRIGIQEIGHLATTIGVFEKFEGSAATYMDSHLFWEHSLACGLAASELAGLCGVERVDDYFVWGMLHDVGRLILLEHAPTQYANVWETAQRLNVPLEAVEPRMMLVDHCDILEQALEHWEFPREFITPVVRHHGPASSLNRMGPERGRVSAIIALANRMVHALLIGSSGNDTVYPFDDLTDLLGLTPEQTGKVIEAIPGKTRDLKLTMLARSNDAPWPDYALKARSELIVKLVPLCLSMKPDFDAYRLCMTRLGSLPENEKPNVALLYLRDAHELNPLLKKLEVEEAAHGAAKLPTLIILQKGDISEDHPMATQRPFCVARTPVRVAYLIETLNQLVPCHPS